MSDSQPKKYTFLVYAPDYTDEEAFNRRLAVRTKHLEGAAALRKAAVLRIGGAMYSPETLDSPNKKLIGSAMVYEAESIDAVRKIVENDPYWLTGVWDKEKTSIAPWMSAFPLPPVE